VTKAVTVIGQFSGCLPPYITATTEIIDLALDESSNAFVTAFSGFFSLDLKTATCTLIHSDPSTVPNPWTYPNSLSFVPKGTLDPNEEALVGYLGATYVRINTKTGEITHVGTLGGDPMKGYASSGDIVSVKGGGTFLTVTGKDCNDCLVQVDPTNGQLVRDYGPINHAKVYGLAYWAGALYGFDDGGELFEITASGGALTTTTVPGPSGLMQWWGAGSTTSAPVASPDGGTIPLN
jgi:hypothetical protein